SYDPFPNVKSWQTTQSKRGTVPYCMGMTPMGRSHGNLHPTARIYWRAWPHGPPRGPASRCHRRGTGRADPLRQDQELTMEMLNDVAGCAVRGAKNGLCKDWRRRRRNLGIDPSSIGMDIGRFLAALLFSAGAVLMIPSAARAVALDAQAVNAAQLSGPSGK